MIRHIFEKIFDGLRPVFSIEITENINKTEESVRFAEAFNAAHKGREYTFYEAYDIAFALDKKSRAFDRCFQAKVSVRDDRDYNLVLYGFDAPSMVEHIDHAYDAHKSSVYRIAPLFLHSEVSYD